MARMRKRVTMAYIVNDTERRASFKKRKKGLIKKVSELSTLCGVEACAIIYGELDTEPEVWPSVAGAREVLARFGSMPMLDRTRKMVDQEGLTRQRIKQCHDQLERVKRENKRRVIERVVFDYIYNNGRNSHPIYLADYPDFVFVINQLLSDIKEQKERLQKLKAVAAPMPPPPPPPPVAAPQPPELSFWFPAEQEEEEAPVMSVEGYLVESQAEPAPLDDGWDDEFLMGMNFFFPNNTNNNGDDGAGPSGTKPPGEDGDDGGLGNN